MVRPAVRLSAEMLAVLLGPLRSGLAAAELGVSPAFVTRARLRLGYSLDVRGQKSEVGGQGGRPCQPQARRRRARPCPAELRGLAARAEGLIARVEDLPGARALFVARAARIAVSDLTGGSGQHVASLPAVSPRAELVRICEQLEDLLCTRH